MMRSLGAAILLLVVVSVGEAAAGPTASNQLPNAHAGWQPPSEGVVRDGKAAIAIARAVWLSMNPSISARVGGEEIWQSDMIATLQDGVWEVTNKMSSTDIGGALFIYISQRDGRIVGIYLTQ
jgi:hypothetical protein